MSQIIYHHQLSDLAEELSKSTRLVAPLEKHPRSGASKIVFSDFRKGDQLVLAYPTTVLPPTEFLLPADEVIFTYEGSQITPAKPAKQIIFGVNYEDLEGISRLKKVFSTPVEDEPFLNRAARTIVVAIDRFSPPAKIDFDLYLQMISAERYAAYAGSAAGKKILRNPLFKNEKIRVPKVIKAIDPLLSDPLLAEALKKSKQHPVWDELAERCFGCGICAFVCPMCFCFRTSDQTDLDGQNQSGKRIRAWDSCFSEDFAATSGHNFRPELRDRIYNWHFHKFVRMPNEYHFPGCVDCNRCVIFCPAKINYRATLQTILDDYRKKVK